MHFWKIYQKNDKVLFFGTWLIRNIEKEDGSASLCWCVSSPLMERARWRPANPSHWTGVCAGDGCQLSGLPGTQQSIPQGRLTALAPVSHPPSKGVITSSISQVPPYLRIHT